ncbi:HEAT repeat domain-containing protein [Leptolyngbya sp. FACHB-671]|nr:HEAT repeat domain-containing protein [Leptolyngbya sp. FACHB-671]
MVGAIAGILGEWAVTKVADVLFDQTGNQVRSRLEKNDLQQAIACGIKSAMKAGVSRSLEDFSLFYYCDDLQVRQFKQAVFCDSTIQTELQRPFRNEGKPRLEFLIAGFKQVESDCGLQLNVKALKPWLEAFSDAYFSKTSAIQFQIAKEDYCEQLANWYDDVKFAGIEIEGTAIEEAKELQKIFVMPDAIAETRYREVNTVDTDKSQALSEIARAQLELDTRVFENGNHRQQALLQEQRQQAQQAGQQWSGAKVLASQLLSQSNAKKLVLLGTPGSGKTTLMSYFAVMLAERKLEPLGLAADTDWLPILIRIRELALYPKMSILDYAKQFAEKTMSCIPLPGGFFEAWVESGRALILLDGLDEVAEEGKRQEIVRKIENFLGQYSQNRAIVTSRPAGYRRDFFRTSEYFHYQLQPFDNERIERFITNWYDNRTPDRAESERRRSSLKKALENNERIKTLARNPLLLTIIALIHRYQAELPRDRYRLYDKAVNTLLTSWDQNREITAHKALQYLGLDDLRRLMERLAYWIHTQGGTGDNEGGTLIDRDELINQLSQYIREQKKLERNEAKSEAERFLRHIRERTGLLNEQGQDCYSFVHKTFQEYLTAQEIRDLQEEGFEIVLERIQTHLHDPHWREVLLLLIAQQKRSNPGKCLKAILESSDPYGKWLHRNLFFAGACLMENISVDEDLSERILDELVALETSDLSLISTQIKNQVFQTLSNLHETKFEQPALQKLLNAPADKIDAVRLQEYRAALGDEDEAITSLLDLLKDEDRNVRGSAADAIGNLGKASDEVIAALLSLLKDEDRIVQGSAVGAIGNLGKASDEVIAALLSLLKDEDSNVRWSAADAIGNLGKASDEVIAALLSLLKDEDSNVRWSAVDAISNLGKASDEVIAALLSLLKDEDRIVRWSAANAISNLGKASDEVIAALLSLLKDEDRNVQGSAADTIGKLGKASDEVIAALLSLLKDEDSNVRWSAADAIGKLGKASDEVIAALLSLLKDEDSNVRWSAANAISNLGKASDEVIAALLSLLKDEDRNVRGKALLIIGKLGKVSDEVIAALLSLLKDEDSNVRWSTANAIGELGKVSDEVIAALLSLLKDEDRNVRGSAAGAIAKLKMRTVEILPVVVRWLESNPEALGVGNGVDLLWQLATDS